MLRLFSLLEILFIHLDLLLPFLQFTLMMLKLPSAQASQLYTETLLSTGESQNAESWPERLNEITTVTPLLNMQDQTFVGKASFGTTS